MIIIDSAIEKKKLNVLVIGDESHKVGYKKIIENYNYKFLFIDGVSHKKQRSIGLVKKADIVILMIRNLTQQSIELMCKYKKEDAKIIRMYASGIAFFKRELEKSLA